MQIILLAAAIISVLVTREWGTTIVLVSLTIFNAVLGMRQESKAEASLASLSKMLKNVAGVRRDGEAIEIDEEDLVPGDIVLMEAGNRVPADGRLLLAATLEIEEAALRVSRTPTLKDVAAIDEPDVALGDRHCVAFMNSSVTRGRGEMIVTSTGMGTEIGHIADMLNETKIEKTPLQKQLDRLTIIIASIAGLAFVVMVIFGLFRGDPFQELFVAGVALAVASIPTGLPAVVTTMFSMGTRALADQHAIVKRLPSVETLGSTSAICSDKTGTLTLNKMTAREFQRPRRQPLQSDGRGVQHAREAAACWRNTYTPISPMSSCRWRFAPTPASMARSELIGDPTEGALIVLAEKGGIHVEGGTRDLSAHRRSAV